MSAGTMFATLVGLAIVLAACDGATTVPTVADGPPDGGAATTSPAAGDGPVRALSDEESAELERDGGVVLAEFELSDGVVVAMGYPRGDWLAVELVGVPDDLLRGGAFGGSGEGLGPDDVCNFQTVDEGFTVVVTSDPGVTVTVDGPDGRRAVEEARPVTVGSHEFGVVLVEVGHTQGSPTPTVEPGGPC